MVSSEPERPDRSYLSLIHEISQELTTEDSKGLSFLAGVSNAAISRAGGHIHCCCVCMSGAGGHALDLLKLLQEMGVYSQFNMDPLVSLLQDVGRLDLASKCEQLMPPSPSLPSLASPAALEPTLQSPALQSQRSG